VAAAFTRCLADPAVRAHFAPPPGGGPLLWREASFEAVMGNQWVSGTFDRVVVERDPAGRPTRATVTEFKSGQRPDPGAHRAQLELYRQAVGQLTGLPASAVGGAIVFTATPEVVVM
jgi:hypothetical protein